MGTELGDIRPEDVPDNYYEDKDNKLTDFLGNNYEKLSEDMMDKQIIPVRPNTSEDSNLYTLREDMAPKELASARNHVLMILNMMILSCEPIKYSDFNTFLTARDGDELQLLEKDYPVIGIKNLDGKWGISTLSLLATVTDLLCGKRLAANIDDNDYIVSFQWLDYRQGKDTNNNIVNK